MPARTFRSHHPCPTAPIPTMQEPERLPRDMAAKQDDYLAQIDFVLWQLHVGWRFWVVSLLLRFAFAFLHVPPVLSEGWKVLSHFTSQVLFPIVTGVFTTNVYLLYVKKRAHGFLAKYQQQRDGRISTGSTDG